MPLADIRIRADLRPEDLAGGFAQAGVIQAHDFLEPEAADAVVGLLAGLPYVLAAPDENGETLIISDEVVRRFGEQKVRDFLQDVLRRAAGGFAYLHQTYALQDEYARAPGAPIARVTEFLQSRAFLDVGAAITGCAVDGVRVQASHYRRGDFLTLHDDRHRSDDRVAAFTLGFTRGWRADWGGQLLFHDDRGDVEQGFIPRFNTLTVFRVPRPHSVAPVAAYAAQPRLSLTGWFVREKG
ncbi:2OG-Fe(II) oxygenase family protein [Phenylobacterium sp.]|uniref:2OG-Fe(II) oxygenase n=1 Tax=Phenylobacterium sp. TaxID=1871053 RepID=UPI0035B0D48F